MNNYRNKRTDDSSISSSGSEDELRAFDEGQLSSNTSDVAARPSAPPPPRPQKVGNTSNTSNTSDTSLSDMDMLLDRVNRENQNEQLREMTNQLGRASISPGSNVASPIAIRPTSVTSVGSDQAVHNQPLTIKRLRESSDESVRSEDVDTGLRGAHHIKSISSGLNSMNDDDPYFAELDEDGEINKRNIRNLKRPRVLKGEERLARELIEELDTLSTMLTIDRGELTPEREAMFDHMFVTIDDFIENNHQFIMSSQDGTVILNIITSALENFIKQHGTNSRYGRIANEIYLRHFNPNEKVGESPLSFGGIKRKKNSNLKKTVKKKKGKCLKQNTKKYLTRKSPPYPASKCKNKRKKGNDGKMYLSYKASGQTIYKWLPVKSKAVQTKKKRSKAIKANTKKK